MVAANGPAVGVDRPLQSRGQYDPFRVPDRPSKAPSPSPQAAHHRPPPVPVRRRLLITAGPTQEPLDSVRYIGNRSSGRLGLAIADAALDPRWDGETRGWDVCLLLGPTHTPIPARLEEARHYSRARLLRFRTTAELQALLREHAPWCDVLIMAAAVADFRPKRADPVPLGAQPEGPSPSSDSPPGKIRRHEGGLTLELEATPDLIAEVARHRRPGQVLVGFALEERARMMDAARDKLARKGLDFIVANPLETMDSAEIEGVLLSRDGRVLAPPGALTGHALVSKEAFAQFLLRVLAGE